MKLRDLAEMQRVGAFKVSPNATKESAVVAGMQLTDEQCVAYAIKVGWTGHRGEPGHCLINRTNSFLKAIRSYVDASNYIYDMDVMFEVSRISNTTKMVERIVLTSADYRLTVLHGYPGVGGSYAVFDSQRSTTIPAFTCASLKRVCEFFMDSAE